MSQFSQDVEEFIAENEYDESSPTEIEGFKVIPSRDVRAWMSGHVRVPVDLLRKRFESPNTIDQCEAEAEFLALLNASKRE